MNLTSPGCAPCSLQPCLKAYACIIKKDHDNRKCKALLLSHCIIMSWRWVAQEGSIASGVTGFAAEVCSENSRFLSFTELGLRITFRFFTIC